jgi:hypothetical protein
MRSRSRNEQRSDGACTAALPPPAQFRRHPMTLPGNRADHIIAAAIG